MGKKKKPPKLRPLSEQELSDSVDHLRYEIDMLRDLGMILTPGRTNPKYDPTYNAQIESFVVHARGLIAFLYYRREKDDDVMARDYFDPGAWDRLIGRMSSRLQEVVSRAGKEVAHITTFRIGKTLVEKNWDVPAIATEIFALLRLFFKSAPVSRIPPGTEEWLARSQGPFGPEMPTWEPEPRATRST